MSHLNTPRWQFCWYGWSCESAFRVGLQRFPGSMGKIYAYRLMLGPLDIRRWRHTGEGTK